MWLLETETFSRLSKCMETHYPLDVPRAQDEEEDKPLFVPVNRKAVISIRGILTDEPDFFMELFGGGNTTYGSIFTRY